MNQNQAHISYKKFRGSAGRDLASNLAISNISYLMDAVFLLGEGEISNFLHNMLQSLGCTYICLWSYSPQPSNYLRYKSGVFSEKGDRASSSSGSLAQRLFNEYRQSLFVVESRIPGLAFLNNITYMELNSADLQRLASTEIQRHFYQEAGIKTALFMGCNRGEMELGFSDTSQANLEMELRNWFPEDFSRQLVQSTELIANPPLPTDQNPRPASSSSSLKSLSYDSSEYSPLLFDIPTTGGYIHEPSKEAIFEQALRPSPSVFTTTASTSPHQQAIQALSQIRNIQIPTNESEDAAMTKAILAVLSSSPSSALSSSSSLQPHQFLPPTYPLREQSSAFKWFNRSVLAPNIVPMSARYRRQNMLKRSIAFLRVLNSMRSQEQMQATRTSIAHVISERRRREKLNESFQALRSLLPPGTKKDKASVLTSTTEYLSSLEAQVAELSKRNQILEAQLLPKKAVAEEASSPSNERVEFRITQVSTSTSEERMIIDLQVIRRGEVNILDMVVALLGFLKTDQNLSLLSIEAKTTIHESTSVNRLNLRLKIESDEWDEHAFQEAVKRVVNDMAQK